MAIKVAVHGAAGRMGRMLVAQIMGDSETELSGALEREDCTLLGQDAGTVAGLAPVGIKISSDAKTVLSASNALIVFSAAEPTMAIARQAAEAAAGLGGGFGGSYP